MKKTTTRRALFLSFVAMFLCFTMLIGTTYAWFTDSVTSATNQIVAGNLDIELEYAPLAADGSAVLEDGKIHWTSVNENVKLFDDAAKWEPGHTEVAYLKVSNLGTLALKYQLSVNFFDEIVGKTVADADIKLSDYLVFKAVGIAEAEVGTFSREAAIAKAGSVQGISSYVGEATTLAAKDTTLEVNTAAVDDIDYVALIIYMPTTVGNEANYKTSEEPANPNKYVPSIKLGVNLFATQVEAEDDSFGNDYDAEANLPTIIDAVLSENANAPLVISDGKMSVVVPDDADSGKYTAEFSNKKETTDSEGRTTLSVDVVLKKDGAKVSSDGTTVYTLTFNVGTGKNIVAVTHNNEPITDYTYDSATGIISFTTTSFSPFSVVFEELLDMSKVDSVLKNNDWETIQKVIKAGKVEEAGWKVGDVSPNFDINGLTRNAMLIGVNQDGENTATFMIIERVGVSKMRETWTNEGGYGETIVSRMLDEMESTVSIADYMVNVNKSYYYEVFSQENYKVGVDSGKLFLLSLEEVGMMDEAESYEYRYLDVLDKESDFVYTYFQTDDAKKRGNFYWKTKENMGDFWLRSSETDSTVGFFAFDRDGDFGGGSANVTNDILPAFVIG